VAKYGTKPSIRYILAAMRYAISDIHGCNETFKALLQQLRLQEEDQLFVIGDLIDRGPDSKGVFDTVFQLQADGIDVVCLRGNHEQMLLDALYDFSAARDYGLYGRETLQSFGVSHVGQIPDKYLEFMQSMPLVWESDEYILVHGGLLFTPPEDPLTPRFEQLWKRDWYANIDYQWLGQRFILHGHTPIGRQEIMKLYLSMDTIRVLNLDAGCVFSDRFLGLGSLCAFSMDEKTCAFQVKLES
jgi:serine/threonine protein phosphatase 1